MIQAVIFDMDGVLIDSVATGYRVRTSVLKGYGVDIAAIPDPHGERHKGSSLKDLVGRVKEHTGQHIEMAEISQKIVAGVHDDLKKNNVTADPALIVFLNELKSHGVPLALVTSALKASAENKLRILGIEDFFTLVIAAEDVKDHKPHPESYLAAIARLGVEPSKSVIFEDSAAGIQAAVGAGAAVVGVTKYAAKKEPLPSTALTIDSWEDMSYKRLLGLID